MVATLQNIYVFEIERILSPGSGPGGNTSGPVAHSKPLAFSQNVDRANRKPWTGWHVFTTFKQKLGKSFERRMICYSTYHTGC
jgi:hypothetical protein